MTQYSAGFLDALTIVAMVFILAVGLWRWRQLRHPYIAEYQLSWSDLRRAKRVTYVFGRTCQVCAHYRDPEEFWADCTLLGGKVICGGNCEEWRSPMDTHPIFDQRGKVA